MNLQIPPEPIWRTIKGQHGMITYNAFWLQTNVLDWHFFVDGPQVTLDYLSIDAMPWPQSVSVEFGYEGKIYKGIVYEVTE